MNSEKGFTLIEMIMSLVLLGIVGVFSSLFFVKGIEGYIFADLNASMAQQAQYAFTRLILEFENLTDITPPLTSNAIVYQMQPASNIPIVTRSIGFIGNELKLNVNGSNPSQGNTILNNLSSFTIACYKDFPNNILWATGEPIQDLLAIQITIVFNRSDLPPDVQTFTTIINPRRNKGYNAPVNWNI